MFTGLVQAIGSVHAIEPGPGGTRLWIDLGAWSHRPELGESIAVSGVCLTVAEPPEVGQPVAFDAIPETIAQTTIGAWSPGHHVNLERALRAGDPLGGHSVQGHVDGVGEVVALRRPEREGDEWRTTIQTPAPFARYAIPKGSVAVDGVSLTIAATDPIANTFDVALIPVTLADTTLGQTLEGARVNLESDILARTIVHYLEHHAPHTQPSQ